MNIKTIWVLTIIAFGFPSVNLAEETKTELVIFKEATDKWILLKKGRTCEEVYTLKKGKDASDLRLMNNYFCEGEYSLTLDGPPGTTVTLYGQFFFEDNLGSLTLTKTDDRQVWVWDLEPFPFSQFPMRWHKPGFGGQLLNVPLPVRSLDSSIKNS